MTREIDKLIREHFPEGDHPEVLSELARLSAEEVMAGSEFNLNNARCAAIYLSGGNIEDLRRYIDAAKVDFRDVIMWAMQQAQEDKSSGSAR